VYRKIAGVTAMALTLALGALLPAAGMPMGDAVLIDAKFAQDMYAAGDYFVDLRPLL